MGRFLGKQCARKIKEAQVAYDEILILCFATILSALKIARFPAATAVPPRLSVYIRIY
jgi:hypothetical protein